MRGSISLLHTHKDHRQMCLSLALLSLTTTHTHNSKRCHGPEPVLWRTEPVTNYLSYKIKPALHPVADVMWLLLPQRPLQSLNLYLLISSCAQIHLPTLRQPTWTALILTTHLQVGGNQHTVLFLSHQNAGRKCSSSSLLNLQPYNSVYLGVNSAPFIHRIWVSGLNHQRANALPQLPHSVSKHLHAYLENNRHELLHEK